MPTLSRILWSCHLERAELRQCAEPAANCPYRTEQADAERVDGAMRCVIFSDAEAAAARVRRVVSDADDMVALRRLAVSGPQLAFQSDQQVVDAVARKLMTRDLCLLTERRFARPIELVAAPQVSDAVPISRLRPPMPELPPPPPMPEVDLLEDLNQISQAAALRDASELGVPFCEVCEKARQAAQAGAA